MHELARRVREIVERAQESDGSIYDFPEWEKLYDEWNEAREAARPWPVCCSEMRKHRGLVYARFLDESFYDTPDSPEKYQQFSMGWAIAYEAPSRGISRGMTQVVYPERCPFCGQVLPKIVPKKKRPEPLCKIEDGGYYCSECRERAHGCLCFPPHAAYEIVPNGPFDG
jgi:hypothetical protein